MKTAFGSLLFGVLAAIAIGSVLSIFAQHTTTTTTTATATAASAPTATPAERTYTLKINGDSLPVKNLNDFVKLLNGMEDDWNRKMVHLMYKTPTGIESQDGPHFNNVNTSKVIASETAETGKSIPIPPTGVNVTQRVTTDSIKAFQDVLNSFATPTPTATPGTTSTASP
jgi:hypothetical protein